MPRIRHQYRLHKASGQAFVALNGKRIYLGKFGSERLAGAALDRLTHRCHILES